MRTPYCTCNDACGRALAQQILWNAKEDVIRTYESSNRRLRDLLAETTTRIAALQAQLSESEQSAVGVSNGEAVRPAGRDLVFVL